MELAIKVSKDYTPDCVIFIARGGVLIGQVASGYFSCPLYAVKAFRKGSRLKRVISMFLKYIPKNIKRKLREREMNSTVHQRHSERNVKFLETIPSTYHHILLVDDSVDTGASALQVKDLLMRHFQNAEVRIAAINVFTKSEKIIHTDYFIYRDAMIMTPASVDSPEYEEFVHLWDDYARNRTILL